MTDSPTADELKRRGHSLRNFSPEEFIAAYQTADDAIERAEVREALRRIDGGRWWKALDTAHSHIGHSDLDARAHLTDAAIYGDEFLTWIAVFGLCEDLSTFPDLTGIDK